MICAAVSVLEVLHFKLKFAMSVEAVLVINYQFLLQTPREAMIMMSAICERLEANPDKGMLLHQDQDMFHMSHGICRCTSIILGNV